MIEADTALSGSLKTRVAVAAGPTSRVKMRSTPTTCTDIETAMATARLGNLRIHRTKEQGPEDDREHCDGRNAEYQCYQNIRPADPQYRPEKNAVRLFRISAIERNKERAKSEHQRHHNADIDIFLAKIFPENADRRSGDNGKDKHAEDRIHAYQKRRGGTCKTDVR
jgi:hypothetical protein